MTTIQKIFALSFFAFIALFNQTTADAASFIKFDGIDGEAYAIERVEAPPADGKHLIATHKKSGGKLMLLARGGKIQRMFALSASGKTRTLEPGEKPVNKWIVSKSSSVNSTSRCFTIPSGGYICVSGAQFADSSSATPAFMKFAIADLPDGVNVLAQTREHILLAAIIEKGELVGMGSINPQGSFNRFTPDTPCSGFIVQPCADGSTPGSYYDNAGKCVAYCTGYIVLDQTQYKPVKPYGLRPNGPCSDFIAQPCRKGTSMVVYYDAHTQKCVMICDY
ncbi:MAG: hypothetical protein ACPG49_03545 [Chitinophagales bacterium]